jgi:hypothetical protein
MRKLFALQVCALVLVSSVLGGMFVFTPVYDEVRSGIVLVLCLSCLKLEPKTIINFTFQTINNVSHPDFVLENLTKGPVFLHYSGDACEGCDVMYPVIKELFHINFGKQEMFHALVTFENATIAYTYINIHHTTAELKNSQIVYDPTEMGGIPMFTVVTLGYDNGVVKPKYATVSGTLAANGCYTNETRLQFLSALVNDSIEMYHQNSAGYHPH